MQLSPRLTDMLNQQITREYQTMLLYTAVATVADSLGLPQTRAYGDAELVEEYGHALKIINYLRDRSATPQPLLALPLPPQDYNTLDEILRVLLEFMQETITANLRLIYKAAQEEADAPTQKLIAWYLDGQVQTEKNLATYLQRVERCTDTDLLDAILYKKQ